MGNVIHVQSDLMQLLGVVGKWHLWETSALFAKSVQVKILELGCRIILNLPKLFIKDSSINIILKEYLFLCIYVS